MSLQVQVYKHINNKPSIKHSFKTFFYYFADKKMNSHDLKSVTILFHIFAAWTPDSSHLPVCGGYMFRRRGPPGPQGVTADVTQPASTQRPRGPHHVRTHGSGARAQLRGDRQELCVQGHQGPLLQTDPGVWRHV